MNNFLEKEAEFYKKIHPLEKNIVNIQVHSIYPIVKCISEAHSDLLLKSNITSSSLESFFCVSAMQNCVL